MGNPFDPPPGVAPTSSAWPPPPPPPPSEAEAKAAPAVADEDAQAFAAWKAERDRAAAEKALNEAEAVADAAAEADRQRRRDAEDSALCPSCKAPRNNPSRIGNPQQEYLNHCWRCGFGAGAGQTYPAVN